MIRLTFSIFVKLFLCVITISFTSCSSDIFDSNSNEVLGNIATAISVTQVKASGKENISRGETKAPEMRNFKVEGAKGEMYMRYTAAAGISGKEYSEPDVEDSRGKMITTATFYDDYGLFAYEYPNNGLYNWSSVYSTTTPSIVNERVLKSKSWMTNEYWPGSGSLLAFYGYAPYNASGVSNLPTVLVAGKPKFHYVVPTEAINQNDLLVSEDDQYTLSNINGGVDVPGNYNVLKTLKFKHACTAVRIAIGDQMAPCTITKIAIKGVYGVADYNYDGGTGNLNDGKWENYSSDLCDYELNADFTVLATDQNKIINSGKYTFMLLPQTVPDGATIEITLNDGEEHVIKAKISGSEWKMGYSVTYFLTTASVNNTYVLDVSADNTSLLSTGSINSMTIQSYKQSFYGSQIAVPWTLTYNYEDDVLGASQWSGSANDILASITKFTGNGGTVGESNTFQVAKQVERSKPWRSTHTATLRAATEQGSAGSHIDLSAGKQTANCYVVSAPGYYKFPLVYGNARNADGSDNTNAYGSATFVDHKDVQITSPYIYLTNGGANVPASAMLVWQDAPRLVTPSSVKLSDDKHYIEFQVEKKNICQGNSVIAVCDANGTIMWSWHIWVTDHEFSNTIEVHNNPSVGGSVISYFMEVPLGWCDEEVRVRDKRKFNFKVTQTESGGKEATITFEQLSADSLYTYGNNAPYYQWGRKDPMLPSNGTGDVEKPFYDYKREWQRIGGGISTGTAIQNPFTFYYVNADWSATHNYDYWNRNFINGANLDNTAVIKTIYDPSISTFNLPRTAAFTWFTSTGHETTNSGIFNVSGAFNKGWNFYTMGWQTGDVVFFYAIGIRSVAGSSNGALGNVNRESVYWTSGAEGTTRGRNLNSGSGHIRPDGNDTRAYGFPVRPVLEDTN